MSFVLSGLLWWRQLKQTPSPSGAGVINCHMWMNKGARLKPFVVFVNVFHLSFKRPNDFAVSWCMWLVALQNEGNFSPLDFGMYFPLILQFLFEHFICFTLSNIALSSSHLVHENGFIHTEVNIVPTELSCFWLWGKEKKNLRNLLGKKVIFSRT